MAIENLSSNYSAKQKDANAPERHEIKCVLEVHRLQKKKKKSQASVSESWYLKTDLCHLRAATLRRCVEQEQAEFGWWIEHVLATVNIASL